MPTRRLLFVAFLLLPFFGIYAQNTPAHLAYDGVLWSPNDTFYVKGGNWEKAWAFTTTQKDTIDLGTDGFPGQNMKVWTTSDTLLVPYVNAPYEQWLYLKVASARDTTVYRLRFNEQASAYPDAYIQQRKGKVVFTIPAAYELANIILYLTDLAPKTGNYPTQTTYSQEVRAHFSPYKKHPLIRLLNKKCLEDDYWSTYYGFRENSICFDFEGALLSFNTPYKQVYWDNTDVLGGQFRNLLFLVQDFADQSGFRDFYAAHHAYYTQLEKREAALLPVEVMWKWLETAFPQRKDAYKIVFSPLIDGSHSTQQFHKGSFQNPCFQECVMFINSTEALDTHTEYPEKLKEGLMSGIVFTEIDHNYVNDATRQHMDAVNALMIDKDFWATKAAQQNYPSTFAIFNEYMTHALFCLYVTETYDKELAQQIIEKRVALMDRRGFIQFKPFMDILLEQMAHRKGTVYAAYGEIVARMKGIR